MLVVSADRFTEDDQMLLDALRDHTVPHEVVRSKVDVAVEAAENDYGTPASETIQQIAADLAKRGVDKAFLISTRKVTPPYALESQPHV